MSYPTSAAVLLVALILGGGCDSAPPAGVPASTDAHLSAASSVSLSGYTVEFLGTTAAPGGTTFRYRVSGSGDVANLNYVFLETACDAGPTALAPAQSVAIVENTEADTTLVGAQWQPGIGEGGSREYALTFAEAEVGAITVVIRAGNRVESALLPGACGNLFDLAGSVFVNDGDDGPTALPEREPAELGIASVRVDVTDPNGSPIASAVTGPDGRYALRLLRGDYDVRVSPAPAAGTFNEVLFASYAYALAPSPPERRVALRADASGVDFGFDPVKESILQDIEAGAYQTDGQPVKVWRRWVREAARDRRCDPADNDPDTICYDEMAGYLDAIFASPDAGDVFVGNAVPYGLAAGADPFEVAGDILGARTRTDEEALFVELFAMQLNWLSGRGSADPLYDQTLIFYFEEVVGAGSAAATASAGAKAAGAGSLDIAIAQAFNGGGGGGEVGN